MVPGWAGVTLRWAGLGLVMVLGAAPSHPCALVPAVCTQRLRCLPHTSHLPHLSPTHPSKHAPTPSTSQVSDFYQSRGHYEELIGLLESGIGAQQPAAC